MIHQREDDALAQGARLKRARRNAGFRLAKEAAAALGVPETTYVMHEARGAYRSPAAVVYARIFGVSPGWLMFGEEPLSVLPRWQTAYDLGKAQMSLTA
jgi:DNA-binding XRE family transcriptional regulator